jgi:hypothetical protein
MREEAIKLNREKEQIYRNLPVDSEKPFLRAGVPD